MIELERHIEILLLDNDCVIVPDLGGFMTHHLEARYDDEDHVFLPPQRTLGFNPQLKLNDSLLAQSYIEAYDISYPEALRRIEAEVSELRQHLTNEGFYELNDIGRLTVNDEGRLEFEPCEAGILTPELYGLGLFEMKPLQALAEEAEETADDTTDGKSEEHQAITIKMSWVRNAVAVAAAVIAFLVMTTPVSYTQQNNVSLSQVNLPLMSKDSNQKKAEPKLDSITVRQAITRLDTTSQLAAPATTEKSETHEVAKKTSAAKSGYCIVLASQVSERNAHEFVSKLQKKGIEASVCMHNHTRRVVCGLYDSKAEAYSHLPAIQRMEGLSEAWVYYLNN